MVEQGQLVAGAGRPPCADETSAHPKVDEVMVFCALFTVGLCFPLVSILVGVLQVYIIFLHQLTPNSKAHLSLCFWLVKTCCFEPLADHFTFIHKVHHRPKMIAMMTFDGSEAKAKA